MARRFILLPSLFSVLICLQACVNNSSKGYNRPYIPYIPPKLSTHTTTIEDKQQETWKDNTDLQTIPTTKSVNMIAEIEKLKKSIKTHNEKERYENFESKLNFCKTLDDKPMSFSFFKKQYKNKIEFNYDTELQEVAISLSSLPFNQTSKKENKESTCKADGYFVSTKAKASGSYVGANSFGVTKRVTKVFSQTYMLVPLGSKLDNGIDRRFVKFKFKASPSDARDLEDNLVVIVSGRTVCNQCSGKVVDFSLVPFSPTLEFPVDGVGFVVGLYYDIEKIVIADSRKNKVYLLREFIKNN